ncbi:MAG: AsnC family transcriptional regulator [Hyphomicrobiales bacterium]|nr:MAG: AsnC family transcriptional regulator [Hyphomicrobiales bacterium]
MHALGGGGPRVLLAYLDDDQRRLALSLDLPKRAPASQTDPDLLWREAERIRAQGWELAADDFFIGLTGVGVPIFDRSGALAGALSISSLTSIVAPEGHPAHLDARRIPEIRTLHSISGQFDMIAVVVAPAIGELDGLIDRIGALEGVERTMSSIILSTRIER